MPRTARRRRSSELASVAPPAGPVSLLIRRIVLRTGATPLRSVWGLAYRLAAHGIASALARACPGVAVYLKGSLAGGHSIPGLSDIDLVVVSAPADEPGLEGARRRWQRLIRLFPPLAGLVPHLWFYREECLAECLVATCLTAGLEPGQRATRAVLLGPRPLTDEMGLLQRPGLETPREDWVSLVGPERRPAKSFLDAQERRLRAWLELQEWWRYAFEACVSPSSVHTPYMCVKLVAEPARLLLWLEGGTPLGDRVRVLQEACQRIPEEEEAFRRALELSRLLPRSPDPPLADALATLLRLSEMIAARFSTSAVDVEMTSVRIEGADVSAAALPAEAEGMEGGLVPLADWRACVVPDDPDEALAPRDGNPADPAQLASAIAEARSWLHPVLRTDALLVLPTSLAWSWGRLRAVQCPLTDPVSFALLDGSTVARFPRLSGWSAPDQAHRAVAEHRSWLSAPAGPDSRPPGWIAAAPDSSETSARALGMLFTAARAALFMQSLEVEEPVLPATVGSTAALLDSEVAREASEVYASSRRGVGQIDRGLVQRFRELVVSLPAYKALP